MGRKRGGGGGGDGASRSSFNRILRRHIESSPKSYETVEQLVEHLRAAYPHYARQKRQPFTKLVDPIFHSISRRSAVVDDSNDDGDTPVTKKRRKTDEKEEKLRLIEAQHLRSRSRTGDVLNNSSGGGSSSSVASHISEEEGSTDEEASTSSADAIYGEKFEPEFDLMKSVMRENLRKKAKKLGERKEIKEDVELEIVDNKGVKNVRLVNEEVKLGDVPSKSNKNDDNGGVGNEIKGPMFKDLGGMCRVIEELKMEVIVPLYHPHLPRHLGVKPMAGILLHGPPGCGKTKLAHAIANETGVPFYKISATELVSGVSGITFDRG